MISIRDWGNAYIRWLKMAATDDWREDSINVFKPLANLECTGLDTLDAEAIKRYTIALGTLLNSLDSKQRLYQKRKEIHGDPS